MLRERAPLEHGAHANGVLEELGARMIDPTRVVEFVQKITSDRLKALYVLRTHLRSPVSEPGRWGQPLASPGAARALVAAFVKSGHSVVIRHAHKRAEFCAGFCWMSDHRFVTDLTVQLRSQGNPGFSAQAGQIKTLSATSARACRIAKAD